MYHKENDLLWYFKSFEEIWSQLKKVYVYVSVEI